MTTKLAIAASSLLFACGAPATQVASPGPDAKHLAVEDSQGIDETNSRGIQVVAKPSKLEIILRARAKIEGSVRSVAPGDTLRTGDYLELFVHVSRAAYVYVIQFFPDGTSGVLFPNQGDVRVNAGEALRVPSGDQWFQLDEHTGEEHVYIVASLRPIVEVDATVHRTVAEIRASGSKTIEEAPPKKRKRRTSRRKTSKKKKQAPIMLAMNTRGLSVVTATNDTPVIKATADSSGLAIFRFSFHHE